MLTAVNAIGCQSVKITFYHYAVLKYEIVYEKPVSEGCLLFPLAKQTPAVFLHHINISIANFHPGEETLPKLVPHAHILAPSGNATKQE